MPEQERTTEEWEAALASPDPRVQWALDIFDQEGEEFTGMVGRAYSPASFGAFPVLANMLRNGMNRVPLRTNLLAAVLCVPLGAFVGQQYQAWNTRRATEEVAMMKHYILTHPEHFPEPKKVKYLDKLEPWRPIRW